MKTTDKYAARMRHNGNSFMPEKGGNKIEVLSAPSSFPREIVLMRIHQILKSARDILGN